MKKNISINLFGTLYAIDEDAYNLLENYIDSMKSYFSRQEGGEEIADDIEHRIAELLWTKKEEGAEAVNIEMVKDIIHTIGNPTDIDQDVAADGESIDDSNSQNNASAPVMEDYDRGAGRGMTGRRLYRDIDDKILGGVCSGVCKYFGCTDPLWFRLGALAMIFLLPNISTVFNSTNMMAFNVSFSFVVPMLYFLLWFIVPAACTPEDRLRMAGKEVNPDNLRDEVLKENSSASMGIYNSDSTANRGGDKGGCLKVFGVGCLVIMAAPFILSLMAVLIGVVCGVIGLAVGGLSLPFMNFGGDEHLQVLTDSYHNNVWTVWGGIVCALFVVITPLVLFVHRLRSKGNHLSGTTITVTVILWIAALICAISSFAIVTNHVIMDVEQYEEERVQASLIELNGIKYNEEDYHYFVNNGWVMKEAENCEKRWNGGQRYTYRGHYPTGDRSVVYLDSDKDNTQNQPMRYTAETHEHVKPGVFRLVAIGKANQKGAYIYAYKAHHGEDTTKVYSEIPCYGGEGGNMIKAASDAGYNEDKIIKELVERLKNNPYPKEDDDDPENEFDAVLRGNDGKGFGWSYVYIDNIEIKEECDLYYGVTTVKDGKCNYNSWFSATDFKLEKIR